MDKVRLIKPIALSYAWSSGTFFGERGFCGRRFCIIIKMTQYPEKTAHSPKSALATLTHVSHGDIKGSSLKRNDTSLKVICGEMTKWAYIPVLSTQNPWSDDSKIWHGISQKDREYRIENNRGWEIKLEEVTREVLGEGEGWYVSRSPESSHWEESASYPRRKATNFTENS